MILRPAKKMARQLAALLVFGLASGARLIALASPTLHFDYGQGVPHANAVSQFMYFVPLISPEPVSVYTNAGNTQCARVVSYDCHTNGALFSCTCEFEFTGSGAQQNVFDHAQKIQQHEKELQAGTLLRHQLGAINVEGTGSGSVEIAGQFVNGQRVINVVQLRFNRGGHVSPVTIDLHDIAYHGGTIQLQNEMLARVSTLTFRRTIGTPKMEVALASLKRKDAGGGLWQSLVGEIKGATANLFLPPLKVEAEGQQAMLDFGLALAVKKSDFTFPEAKRLKGSAPAQP